MAETSDQFAGYRERLAFHRDLTSRTDHIDRRLDYLERRINILAHGVSGLVAVSAGALIFWMLRPWDLAWLAAIIAAAVAAWAYIDRPMKEIDDQRTREEDRLERERR